MSGTKIYVPIPHKSHLNNDWRTLTAANLTVYLPCLQKIFPNIQLAHDTHHGSC